MASRAEKLRRRQHRKDKKRRQGGGPASDFDRAGSLVVVNPPGEAKMSEALWALVEPEVHRYAEDKVERLLTMAVAGWNAALTHGAERVAFLEHLAEAISPEVRREFREVVEMYIRRKEELFPNIHRPIISFELAWTTGKPFLSVLSALA